MHACAYTHAHAHTHTHTQYGTQVCILHARAHTHTLAGTCTLASTHMQAHAPTHAAAHARTHPPTHTHTNIRPVQAFEHLDRDTLIDLVANHSTILHGATAADHTKVA